MSTIYSGKLSGRTSDSEDGTATGIVATAAVTFDGQGNLHWTDSSGRAHTVQVSGPLATLLEAIFTGTGGTAHRFFK